MEPEDGQHLGDCGCGKQDICEGQHGEEETHRLMETAFGHNQENQEDVACDSHNVHETDRDGDPGVQGFQSRDSNQNIPHVLGTGFVLKRRCHLCRWVEALCF